MEKDCNININVEICILITEEEFEERERYYEELYASGGNIEKSSEGFSTEGFSPKFRRSPREALEFSVSEIDNGQIKESVPPSAKVIAVVGSKPLGGTLSNSNIPYSVSDVNPDGENVTKLQNSVSEVSEETAEESTTDAYSELDAKAKKHLNGVEKTIGRAFAQTLNLDIRDDNGREDLEKITGENRNMLRNIRNYTEEAIFNLFA